MYLIGERFFWYRYRVQCDQSLKDECPVDALRACVFTYLLPYILKNNVEFRRK